MTHDPTTCSCCEGPKRPAAPSNRPGLSSIAYRVGTHGSLLAWMLRELPRVAIPTGPREGARPLAPLTTRDRSDPAIALLDAWAVTGDILTFYQERLANESFLRTATETRSVVELARAIGYEPGRGLAAQVWLELEVESGGDPRRTAVVPAGARVQSTPLPGSLPQTFEIDRETELRAEWNDVRLRTRTRSSASENPLVLDGVATRIQPDDRVIADDLVRRVIEVVTDPATQTTKVTTLDTVAATAFPPRHPRGAVTRLASMSALAGASYTESELRALVVVNGWAEDETHAFLRALRRAPDEVGVFRERAGFFGHNAAAWSSLPADSRPSATWEGATIWVDEDGAERASAPVVVLERAIRGIRLQTRVHVRDEDGNALYRVEDARDVSLAEFAMQARGTRLELARIDSSTAKPDFALRASTAFLLEETLRTADAVVSPDVPAGTAELDLDRFVPGLAPGRALVLRGRDSDGIERTEVHVVAQIVHEIRGRGVTTFVELAASLAYSYVRATMTISFNLARASHGETVREVLGSGDATRARQTFRLRRGPLSYLARPSGEVGSSLRVYADGVEWHEVASFHLARPTDRVFVTHRAEDGAIEIVTGDGIEGARLPTGSENVSAVYRVGTGPDGEVGPGRISILAQRPAGVRSVKNALAASGAAPIEGIESIRLNAGLRVRSFDRIVSLLDYEDFVRARGGVSKALASWFSVDMRSVVHVSAGTESGLPLPDATELYTSLRNAIRRVADPAHTWVLAGFTPVLFSLSVDVKVDPDHGRDRVLEDVRASLSSELSYARRELGRHVTTADVMAVVHRTAGVVACRVARLSHDRSTTDVEEVLVARAARQRPGALQEIEPVDLLLLDPAALRVSEMIS